MKLRPMACCAVAEIDGLAKYPSPETAMYAFTKELRKELGLLGTMPSLIIFTGVVAHGIGLEARMHSRHDRDDDYGQAFADFISTKGLGHVIESDVVYNRRSGNSVRLWIWKPDLEKLLTCNFL